MKRRTMILSALGAGGALFVGWGVMPQRSRLGKGEFMLPTQGDIALNGWIKIAADGAVVMAMPRAEMGQGVHTALPMLVAEELDIPLARIRIEQSGADAIYGNVSAFVGTLPFHPRDTQPGQETTLVKMGEWMVGKFARELGVIVTGGSSSVADAWGPVRLAAATVRAQLFAAAAATWGVAASEVSIKDGLLVAAGKSASFAQMALVAAGQSVSSVQVKAAKNFQLLGTNAPRQDVPSKVNGTAQFGIDVRVPDMVFAAVRLCPMIGGSAGAVDSSKALAMPGVERVIQLPALGGGTAGLAVIGITSWHAKQGAQAVDVQWQQRPGGALNTAKIEKELLAALDESTSIEFHSRGSVDKAEQEAKRKFDSLYTAPYLAHATMEPMNCTAQVKDGKVTVWAPTQVPEFSRDIAAKVAGVRKADVTLHTTLLGGGFGRRLEVDFIAQAVHIAKETSGRAVQLLYSREEDMTHDFYRPMHVARLSASIDANGAVSGLRIRSAGDAITPRWFERAFPMMAGPIDAPDKTTGEGLFDIPYNISNQSMRHVATLSGVPVGNWRSVGHSHNAFFSEGFIDEIATDQQVDGLEMRRRLLKDAPRYLAVLNLAAEKASWGSKLPAGQARGIALHESFGAIVAQVVVASVQVTQTEGKTSRTPRVHNVVCAIDCGSVVNPGIIAQQVESSVIYAMSAALYGRIDIVDGQVQQDNFASYSLVSMQQAPRVQTHILPSQLPPKGVGEPAVPPLAPALASAMYALTGRRLREMPFNLNT